MKLELYTTKLSPFAQRVELHLEMKRVEFGRTFPQRDFVRQGEFGAINPIRKVPVLVVNGVPVPETQVICELLEDLFPDPALLPADTIERARVRLLSRVADIYVMGPLVQLVNNLWEKRSDDIASNAISAVERGLAAFEHWIAAGPYAAGEKRSMADCAIPPALFFAISVLPAFGIDRRPERGPKTARYFEAVQKDGDVARCLARMEGGLQERLALVRS